MNVRLNRLSIYIYTAKTAVIKQYVITYYSCFEQLLFFFLYFNISRSDRTFIGYTHRIWYNTICPREISINSSVNLLQLNIHNRTINRSKYDSPVWIWTFRRSIFLECIIILGGGGTIWPYNCTRSLLTLWSHFAWRCDKQ